MNPPLSREFYLRDTLTVARELLGKTLVHGGTSGIIVETEAYMGPSDAAAHSSGGKRTPRTEIMYGEGGYAYVYLIYGMYCCLNVVTSGIGKPECVLIRALEPVSGLDIMRSRRGVKSKASPIKNFAGGRAGSAALFPSTEAFSVKIYAQIQMTLPACIYPKVYMFRRMISRPRPVLASTTLAKPGTIPGDS